MLQFAAVGIGGALGACLRYFISILMSKFPAFPYATLLSNILAGFFIGAVIEMDRQTSLISPNARLFLTTGILGGLSTFSTFSHETIESFRSGQPLLASLNIALNLGLSLFCVVLGSYLIKLLFKKE
ncbi:MAG: fluoride efflux transporter CrcB [Bacillota bacterium]